MLNHLNLLKHQLLATTVVKKYILLHNAKSKEKIKEKKEETQPAAQPKVGFTPRFKAGVTKPAPPKEKMPPSRATSQ